MKLSKIATGAKLPAAKPNLLLLGKFMLMAIGFIMGRRLHWEVQKYVNDAGSQRDLLTFKSLFGTGNYTLNISDLLTMVVAFTIYWITSKKIRVLRWFGVGILLYIVTFESYELIFGQTMGFEVPDILPPPATTSGDGF